MATKQKQTEEQRIPHRWVKQAEQGERVAWLTLYPVKCEVCRVRGHVAQHRIDTGSGDCNGPRKQRAKK